MAMLERPTMLKAGSFNDPEKESWWVPFVALIVVALLVYGGWRFKNWWKFEWRYQAQVQDEIRAMVKPECLNRK